MVIMTFRPLPCLSSCNNSETISHPQINLISILKLLSSLGSGLVKMISFWIHVRCNRGNIGEKRGREVSVRERISSQEEKQSLPWKFTGWRIWRFEWDQTPWMSKEIWWDRLISSICWGLLDDSSLGLISASIDDKRCMFTFILETKSCLWATWLRRNFGLDWSEIRTSLPSLSKICFWSEGYTCRKLWRHPPKTKA